MFEKYRKLFIGIATALLIIVLAFGVYKVFFDTHVVPATITGFEWKQNVAIEEYKTVHESGWSIPPGGRQTAAYLKQSGTEKVSDGYHTETISKTCYNTIYDSKTCYRDNGNGSFESYDCGTSHQESYDCSYTQQVEDYHYEPVYDMWYEYDIERWIVIENFPTSGNDQEPYYDHSYKITDDVHRAIDQQIYYKTLFKCDELGDFDKNYKLEEWKTQEVGEIYDVTTNFLKMRISVNKRE